MSARFRWPSDAGSVIEEEPSSGHFVAFEVEEGERRRCLLLFVLRAMLLVAGVEELKQHQC